MRTRQLTRSLRCWQVFTWMAALAFLGGSAGTSAGIQGTGRNAVIAFGRITAFGSIFVDSVEYAIDNASITVNGQPATSLQLEVGEIVTVQGTEEVGEKTGTAASVSFNADVIGPVSVVDTAARTLNVLGQVVQIDAGTVLGAGIQTSTLGGLQPGVFVAVSAAEDASGTLHAARIDLLAGSAATQVKGTVQALDEAAQTFKLNDLTVDYRGVDVVGRLANGSTALVQATESPAGNLLYASRVQVSSGLGGGANEEGRLEGIITSMSSGQTFTVAGQVVQTDSGTHFVLHGHALAPNLAVSVRGTFTASGILLANRIQAQP